MFKCSQEHYRRCAYFDPVISDRVLSGADPGFPVGGGTNPPLTKPPTYDFANFSEKLHWGGGGGGGAWIRHCFMSVSQQRVWLQLYGYCCYSVCSLGKVYGTVHGLQYAPD